ncbi:hypothetical protein [Actinoallomurus sp. NPDC052274]|uniref:hypothetical protein n=1 Tax=Actinoallomurus sp. NPDC052274 TaxID=3155420 RepID=UPI00342C9D67
MTPDDARAQRLLIPATFITSLGNDIQLIAAALLLVRTERTMSPQGRAVDEALCIPIDRLLTAVEDLLGESAPADANR